MHKANEMCICISLVYEYLMNYYTFFLSSDRTSRIYTHNMISH